MALNIIKKNVISLSLLTSLIVLSGCGGSNPLCIENYVDTFSPSNKGERIEEDLINTNIIEDNYRNYYEIFVGSFADSNNDKIGDLQGVTSKLDYIKELGYNGIWLMPIFPSQSYHKYDADDYYSIDKDYGTMKDFNTLLNEAHKRNIRVIIDLMLNHSSRYSSYFISASNAYAKRKAGNTLTDEEEKWANFYSFSDKTLSGYSTVYNETYKQSFFVESNFSTTMPEFNLESDEVIKEIKKFTKFWLDLGVDGFRLDAVLYYFYSDTTSNIAFLSMFNEYVKEINAKAYIVGECWDSEAIIAKYYASGIDSFFYFPAGTPNGFINRAKQLDGNLGSLYFDGAKSMLLNANSYVPAPFLDNHDMSRLTVTSFYRNKINFGLLSMLNGSPFTYYGDEIGLNGFVKPDQNVRTHMNWSCSDLSYTCNDPIGTNEVDYRFAPCDKQMQDSDSIYSYYKKANLLRNQIPTIARGTILDSSYYVLDDEQSLIVIDKSYLSDRIRIVINLSENKYNEYNYSESDFTNVIGQLVSHQKTTYIGKVGNGIVSLPPYSIAIIR